MLCEWVLMWVHVGKWGEGDNWGKKSAENGRGAGPRRKDFSVCLFHDYPLTPPSPSHTQIHTHLTHGVTQTEASHPVTLPSSANFFTEHLHQLDLDLTESSWIFFNATLAIMTLYFVIYLSDYCFFPMFTLSPHWNITSCVLDVPDHPILSWKSVIMYVQFIPFLTDKYLLTFHYQWTAARTNVDNSVVRLAASQVCIALNCVQTAVTNALD